MLALFLSSTLGFGSFGGSDDLGPCVDTPDAEMKMRIGMTCTEIKAEGKCDSSLRRRRRVRRVSGHWGGVSFRLCAFRSPARPRAVSAFRRR